MAYVKQNFIDGNVLHASELNHMEDGIADAALDDLSNVTNATVVGKIGAGAITSEKLGANSVTNVYTTTLNTTWTGSSAPYTKVQTVNGILSTDSAIVDIIPSETFSTAESQIEAWGNVYKVSVTGNNQITLYATEKPTVSLQIQILCIRK